MRAAGGDDIRNCTTQRGLEVLPALFARSVCPPCLPALLARPVWPLSLPIQSAHSACPPEPTARRGFGLTGCAVCAQARARDGVWGAGVLRAAARPQGASPFPARACGALPRQPRLVLANSALTDPVGGCRKGEEVATFDFGSTVVLIFETPIINILFFWSQKVQDVVKA